MDNGHDVGEHVPGWAVVGDHYKDVSRDALIEMIEAQQCKIAALKTTCSELEEKLLDATTSDELPLLKKLNAEQAERLKAAEMEAHALRARLTAVALVIRP